MESIGPLNVEDFNEILKLVKTNDVIATILPTGVGKSTIMIDFFFKAGYSMFISNPTNPSVENIYNYMKTVIGENNIGSAYGGDVNYENLLLNKIRNNIESNIEDTKIVYVSAGHLVILFYDLIAYYNKKKINTINLKFCDILMLDEAHNGSLDLEIIMHLWKYAYDKGAILPKLLLVSATLNTKLTIFSNVSEYKILRKKFPVEILYGKKDYIPSDDNIYKDLSNEILRIHQITKIENNEGDLWIVFCCGKSEVLKVFNLLNNKESNLKITTLFSGQEDRDEDIFEMPGQNLRKVIISTNIAETSITINNLSFVFDTLIEKTTEISDNGEKLETKHISKASAEQRKGRVGRSAPGTVYRMCTEKFYNNLIEQRPAEIFRVPLYKTFIKLINIGINPLTLFKKLNEKQLIEPINVLKKLKMISQTTPYEIKNIGIFFCLLKLELYPSVILFKWIVEEKLNIFQGIILASIIDNYPKDNFYNYPKKNITQNAKEYSIIIDTFYKKNYKKFENSSIIETIFNIINNILEYTYCNIKNEELITEYCNINKLNAKKFLEIFKSINEICNIFNNNDINYIIDIYSLKNTIQNFKNILKDIYSDKIFIFKKKSYSLMYSSKSQNSSKNIEYILENNLPIINNNIIHKEIIALNTFETQKSLNQPIQIKISLFMPI